MKLLHKLSVVVCLMAVTDLVIAQQEINNPPIASNDGISHLAYSKHTVASITSLAEEMEAALKLHEDAKDYAGEVKAAEAFAKITEKYTSEWLPAYWASYLYTQLTNILVRDITVAKEGTTIDGMISKSQKYLDLAKERKGEMTTSEQADFHNLQGLIYFFKARTAEIEEYKNQHLEERTKSISLAINLDAQNPNAQVMAATELIRYGYNEKDLQKVLGGKLLLENAKKTYQNRKTKRSMTTHWAEDFVNFWLGFANKTIKEYGENEVSYPDNNN